MAAGRFDRPPLSWLRSPTVVLALVAVVAVALLGVAVRAYFEDRDWALVVRVGAQDIDRADLRDRESVIGFVLADQTTAIGTLRTAGRIGADEASFILSGLEETLAAPRDAAIATLIDGSIIHGYAAESGIRADAVDVGDELLRARLDFAERRLRWVRIAWQPPGSSVAAVVPGPAATPPDASALQEIATAVRQALGSGTDATAVVEPYRAAGWVVETGHRWLPASGPVEGVDPEVVAAARAGTQGPLEPVVGTGWVAIADVTDVASPYPKELGGPLAQDARDAGVSDQALRAWATERSERRAVATALASVWIGTPAETVRAEEIVVGPADPEGAAGPWVELAHLAVGDVPATAVPDGAGTPGSRLATRLRALDPVQRRAEFGRLVASASTAGGRSGELGFFVKEQLAPGLAETAFAADVVTGTLLGPSPTDTGEELFLVEARYDGPLDDRSIGALVGLRAGSSTPMEVVRSTAPGESARALGGPWRAAGEVPSGSGAARALLETPIGELSDPFVLGDRLVVARVLERRTATPDEAAVARLSVVGLDAWLEGRRRSVQIVHAAGPSPAPSAGPVGSGLFTPLPQGTPVLPVTPAIPGPS